MIRLDAAQAAEPVPLPTLAPFCAGLDAALQRIGASIREEATPRLQALPPLRALYARFVRGVDAPHAGSILPAELDEIVDAVNTLGGLVGVGPAQSEAEAVVR